MVNKQCAMCGRYFAGELNGDYRCSSCAQTGGSALRPLIGLDSLDSAPLIGPAETHGERRPPQSAGTPAAKWQAA